MHFNSIVEAVFYYAEVQPGKLCIADRNRELTYSEFKMLLCRYASSFSRIGISDGDKVIVEAVQNALFPAVEFALHLIGAVFVPLESNCSFEKMSAIAERCRASAVISVKPFTSKRFQTYTYDTLIVEENPLFDVSTMPEPDTISEILFSTGTTGKEKGIVLSHGNDVAVAENIVYGSDMKQDNVEMIPSPLNHSHGLRSLYANMLRGGTVVLHDSILDMKGFFTKLDRYHVNSIDLVPSALSVILRFSGNKLGEYSELFRYMEFGSAAMQKSDREKICSLMPGVPLYNYYGSTESGRATVYDFNSGVEKQGCIGKPTKNTNIVIVDDNRNVIVSSPEKTGLMASAGTMNMLGYWEDPEETARATDGKYIFSSDEAYIDNDGDIILIGRKGDVISIGGKKVAPDEIENATLQFTGVSDCGCVGVSDSTFGQVPKLFVQVVDSERFDIKALLIFLSEKLEAYKIPREIVIIEKIPRTFNGKLLRRLLK